MSFQLRTLMTVAMLISSALVPTQYARAADADTMPTKAKPVAEIPFFLVNDNRVTFSYNFNGTEPGTYSGGMNGIAPNGKVDKQVYSFTHFDAWAYGTNLFALSLTKSGHNDPAAPCILPDRVAASGVFSLSALPQGDCAGATDIYGSLRSTFGFNQIFNTKAFTVGPLHNVSLEVGSDAESFNGYTAAAKRSFVAGAQFAFDLPYKGYFNVAPLVYNEVNHSSCTQCGGILVFGICSPDGDKEFRTTWAIETNWYMDLGFLPENMRYFSISGRAAWIGPKGSEKGIGIPTGVPTAIEFNSEPIRLTFDASKMAFGEKHSHEVDLWVSYRYWQNKYGYDHNFSGECTVNFVPGGQNTGSCTEKSINTGITVKF
jgi:hypothetical protein